MSEEEKKNSLIDEIKDIYLFLTEKEPTPDDEIESQKAFIENFNKLKDLNAFPNQNTQLENILKKLEEWDTLEYWFIETSLPEEIGSFLNIKKTNGKQIEFEKEEITPDNIDEKFKEKVLETTKENTSNIDISEIVSQVTKQFKGEIDNLKEKINGLRGELGKKDKKLNELEKEKSAQKISPLKKGSKLPPLTIKIPVVKKPTKPNSKKLPKPQIMEKSTLAPIPSEKTNQIEQENEPEFQTIHQKLTVKEEDIKAGKVLTPIPQKIPQEANISEVSTPSKSNNIDSQESGETEKDTSSVEQGLLLFGSKTKEESNILPEDVVYPSPEDELIPPPKDELIIPSKDELIPPLQDEINTPPKKRSSITTMATEEPSIKDEAKKEPKKESQRSAHIAQVKVEEIETKEQTSTGTDLFNVFSPYKEDPSKKKKKKKGKDSDNIFVHKENNESEKKVRMKEEIKGELPSKPSIRPEITQTNIEDLPKDKDSLYQELIALEGKRYSLEKEFKTFENRYEKGSIDENNFKNQSLQIKFKLDEITSRITSIRRIISSL